MTKKMNFSLIASRMSYELSGFIASEPALQHQQYLVTDFDLSDVECQLSAICALPHMAFLEHCQPFQQVLNINMNFLHEIFC